MTRSYKKDIQLLMSILQRQNDIKEAIKRFDAIRIIWNRTKWHLIYVLSIWHRLEKPLKC